MVPQINPDVRSVIPGSMIGLLVIESVQAKKKDEALWNLIEVTTDTIYHTLGPEDLQANEIVQGVRKLHKATGFDPSRYRPSPESFIRRVLKGHGVPQINSIVDVNTLCSLEFYLPICVYDFGRIEGKLGLRMGEQGETLKSIDGKHIDLHARLVLTDETKVLGTLIADSAAAMVTLQTTSIVFVAYAYSTIPKYHLENTLNKLDELVTQHAGGSRSVKEITVV